MEAKKTYAPQELQPSVLRPDNIRKAVAVL